MKKIHSSVLGLSLILSAVLTNSSQGTVQIGPSAAADSFQVYTKVGDKLPQFSVTMLDGKRFSLAEMKGKVLVLNLWATWCGPCKLEMPRLEKEIWRNSSPGELAMLAIAREETKEKIEPFRKENGYTFPMAADPDRSIFKLFASAGIPRTYIVSRDGTIVYQSLGYVETEFNTLKSVLEAELKRGGK